MTIMTEDQISKAVHTQLGQSVGFDQDTITKTRKEALDYYFMRPRGDEVAGCSNVISGDLSAMVEAVLSQMMDAFTTDSIVEFEPNGAEDEDQAQLESDTVAHFIMDANNGYMNFLAAIKDALLLRNGIMKVWVDERSTVETQEYTDVDPIAFQSITTVEGVKVDVLEYDVDAQTLKVKETTIKRELKVEAVPLEDFMYTPNYTSLNLQDIPFCAERMRASRSSLIEQGFPKSKVNSLKPIHEQTTNQKDRNPGGKVDHLKSTDKSQDQIEYFECYVLIDKDGDGIAERRRIIISDKVILDDILVSKVAYAAGAVLINPHRFLGVSLFDKLKQIQDINTGLTRAALDNANATNKSRLLYREGKVNQDDLDDGRVNGQIGVFDSHNGALADAVAPLVVPDISQGILANIEYQKRNRAELGGASLEMASGQVQLASDQIGSQGLDRAYSVMEQLAGMMTKIIAETLIRNVYLLTHATLREFFDQPVNIRRSGKWSSPVPSEWESRNKINVKIGMSPGERSRKISMLGSVLDKQIALADQGLDDVIVNIGGFHNTLMDWSRAGDIDNPEQYFLDPSSDESKQALLNKQQATQKQQQAQSALLDEALGLERIRVSLDKRMGEMELQFKYWSENLKSEVEEAKIVGNATIELQKAQKDGKTQQETNTD